MGVLKVAAMPPAAPAATISTSMSEGWRLIRPIVEESEAAISTIGPSRPAEPPPPIVKAVAISLAGATIGRTKPPVVSTAIIV